MAQRTAIRQAAGVLLASLTLLHVPASAGAQVSFPSDSSVTILLQGMVDNGRSPGIVVGLLDSDGSRRVISYGTSGPGRLLLDGHSVFEIGSITKLFTATLLADMVRRKQVHLDDPVEKFLPSGVKVPSRNGRQITLLDITTHRSGLPGMPSTYHIPDPLNPFADYSVQLLYDFLSGYELPRDPGSTYEYSNLAMGLLGHALARQAGATYEALLRQRILGPLGMQETRITLTPAMRTHLARGHDRYGDTVPSWQFLALAGAGAISSTASDMLTFAAANLSARTGSPYTAMRDAHTAREPAEGLDSIGFNWFVSRPKDRVITWHQGVTGGYRTFLGLDIAARRAVVVLTNSGEVGANDLGFHLLDSAVPLDPPPVDLPVVQAYRTGGATLAIARYQELRATAPNAWIFTSHELNLVGYWLLGRGRAADAVALFRLNVRMYPDESNPYDSLGEGLLALGDTVQAIDNYKRSVVLNPENTNGIAVLKRLKAAP